MSASRLLPFAIAAACLAAATDGRAQAPCRLCSTPATGRTDAEDGKPVELQIETSLSFDRLILAGAGQGVVVIRPDGSSSTQGAIEQISPRAMPGTATIRGEPGRALRIELPRRVTLYSLSGGEMTFDRVESDLPALPRLNSAGILTFRFGGRLTVTGNGDGDYRGDFPITVEYL